MRVATLDTREWESQVTWAAESEDAARTTRVGGEDSDGCCQTKEQPRAHWKSKKGDVVTPATEETVEVVSRLR
jgi:hypothetical protein